MKPRPKRIIAAAIVGLVALVFVGSAVAMPVLEGPSSSSGYVVRPDDRAGPRGVPVVSQAYSASPVARGEHSFGGNQPIQALATSSGSEYDWSKTIGISAAAVALALCLAGLTLVGMRQRKVRLSV